MRVVTVIGTEKGGFLCRSDAHRRDWTIEGPFFKGWRVTATARTSSGRYLLATASQVYGPGLHASSDLNTWTQIERRPAYPEGGESCAQPDLDHQMYAGASLRGRRCRRALHKRR